MPDNDYKGLVGLQNLGNTCYMNSALQALSNCQQLTRFVLSNHSTFKKSGLTKSYADLMKLLWLSSGTLQYAVPSSVLKYVKCIYPAFRGCTQQDTQEFLRCFLEQLHDELKQPVSSNNDQPQNQPHPDTNASSTSSPTTTPTPTPTPTPTSTNFLPSSSSSLSLHKETQGDTETVASKSIISDTFEFRISSSVVCSSCNNVSTTKEVFKDLSIPIPSADHPFYKMSNDNGDIKTSSSDSTSFISSKMSVDACSSSSSSNSSGEKSVNYQQASDKQTDKPSIEDNCEDKDDDDDSRASLYSSSYAVAHWFWSWLEYISSWFWGQTVTLDDCLSIFFGSDPLEGDNEYSCEVCTKKNRGIKFLQILDLPEVLCIHFKRYGPNSSGKITTHVSFPIEGLDLARFMSPNSKPQCTTYNLIACICHHGSALLTGHYTTYALNCYDCQWYEFDDQYVTMVQSYQVENSEAYILFYQKTEQFR